MSCNLSYSFGTRAQPSLKYMKALVCLVVSSYKKLSYQTTFCRLSWSLTIHLPLYPRIYLSENVMEMGCEPFSYKKLP